MDSALLVIDMQNGFLHPQGSATSRGLAVPDRDKPIERAAGVIAGARRLGQPVLYTRHCHRPDLTDIAPAIARRYPADVRPLVDGTWDAAIVDALRPRPGDVMIAKNRYDAFLHTRLDAILRRMKVRHLIVAGVLTDMCVESTVRSAEQRDYAISVVSDCVAAADTARNETSLQVMSTSFADVAPWREVIRSLSASASVPTFVGGMK